jgi:hypothetical protein
MPEVLIGLLIVLGVAAAWYIVLGVIQYCGVRLTEERQPLL